MHVYLCGVCVRGREGGRWGAMWRVYVCRVLYVGIVSVCGVGPSLCVVRMG